MPTINKTSLQTVSSGQARPTLISGGAAGLGNIRGSKINARVNITPERTSFIPEKDIVGPVVAHVGNQLGQAAYTLAEKDAEMEAQTAALAFEQQAHSMWLGSGDPLGDNYRPGYASTTSMEAVKGLDTYQNSLTEGRAVIASGLGDMARAKFLAKSQGTFTAARNQGAAHSLNARSVWEKQLQEQTLNQHFQSVDEALASNDYQSAMAKSNEFVGTLLKDADPKVAGAGVQEYHKGMVSYLASTDNASQKIAAYQEMHKESMSMGAQTAANQAFLGAVKRENQKVKQVETDAEHQLSKKREDNNLRWFKASFDPDVELNMEAGMSQVESGLLSPSMYLAVSERRESKSYMPSLPADKEIELKRQLVNEDITMDEALEQVLDYDDASVRRLGNFAVNTQGYAYRNDLRYGYERIEKMATVAIPMRRQRQVTILNLQRQYEKDLKKLGSTTALNNALNALNVQAEVKVRPEIIKFSGAGAMDIEAIGPEAARKEIIRRRNANEITPDEAEMAAGEILRYQQSLDQK